MKKNGIAGIIIALIVGIAIGYVLVGKVNINDQEAAAYKSSPAGTKAPSSYSTRFTPDQQKVIQAGVKNAFMQAIGNPTDVAMGGGSGNGTGGVGLQYYFCFDSNGGFFWNTYSQNPGFYSAGGYWEACIAL
jgi:hypothetical protein